MTDRARDATKRPRPRRPAEPSGASAKAGSAPAAPSAAPAAPPVAAASEDEATLWQRAGDGDDAARARLAERHMPFARRLAGRMFARRTAREIEFAEYEQLAMVGLMEAVQRYVPDRGAKFTTYALPRIQGAILNGLEQLTERQQQIAFRRRVLAERTESLTPETMSSDPTQRLLLELRDIGVGVALGLILEGTGMVLGGEALPEDAYASLELRRLHRQLWQLVERLSDRERRILELHYRQGIRFDAIAETLEVSKGRISQLHKRAVERLRALVSKAESVDVSY